jgi:hypothetical protein
MVLHCSRSNPLTRVRYQPGRTQQTGIFCGKTLLLTSSGAREQESKSKKKNKNKKSKRARMRKQEKEWQNPVPFKENYPPPRTYYSLIGCSPSAQLSSRERQNTWRENCPCTCADYVYHLEHSCQRHLIMANVRAASHKGWDRDIVHMSSLPKDFMFLGAGVPGTCNSPDRGAGS